MSEAAERLTDYVVERSTQRIANSARDYDTARWMMLAVLGFGLLVAASTIWFLNRDVSGPTAAMAGVMRRLAHRDWSVTVPGVGRRDEIGQMAEAVATFRTNGMENERLVAEQAASEKRAEAERKAALDRIAAEFEGSIGAIVKSVSGASDQLQLAAQTMMSATEETTAQSSAVAAASEQASANVQTVSAAAEQLAASIEEISRQVTDSARITAHAVADADRSADKVKRLSDSAQKIGDVVGLISNIAGQTNLLALNATIEAARAGETGKGFAVVAQEVKTLAEQTAKATSDIAKQIAEIQEYTADSVEAITAVAGVIQRINGISSAIAASVEEQGVATKDIASNVHQASQGTAEVSANIMGVSQAAGEAAIATGQVLQSASALGGQASALRTQVDIFLRSVRAG